MTKLLKTKFLGFIAVFTFSFSAIAQEVEEVVVTATKKAESVQDLAVSIEAFTSDDIEANMIDDFDDLAENVPGLIIGKGIGSGASYAIRGIGSYGVGAAVVGAVQTANNGHSVNSSTMADLGFFDLERVEVLKGPQGTLFGRNAVAGMINLISARPTNEFGGYVDVEVGNLNMNRVTSAINIPINDNIRSRLAVTQFVRDGMVTNIRTGEKFDDRNANGVRLSIDADVLEDSTLRFTYERYEGDDNRNNIGTGFCQTDELLGCHPLEVGPANSPADSRGSTAALFNFLGGLHSSAFVNTYRNAPRPNDFSKAYLTRIPEHNQIGEFSQLEFITDITDELTLNAKFSYQTRNYYHMNDNDYSHSDDPFPGILNSQVPINLSIDACFLEFCETASTDRTYEFSKVDYYSGQSEISLISNYDGPFNFVVGYYHSDERNHNRYYVQTLAWNLTSDFSRHPYSTLVYGTATNPGDFSAYGGIPFYQIWLLGGLAGAPDCALDPNNPGIPQTLTTAYGPCLQFLVNNAGGPGVALPPYHVDNELAGFHYNDKVRSKSQALYGELYFDLDDATKLTLGFRYNDDIVSDRLMQCLADLDCEAYTLMDWAQNKYTYKPNYDNNADDGFAYKIALQHNLADDQMVYASYTTASKAGGFNPVTGGDPSPFDKEETGVFEVGIKSILMDGAVLFNASAFINDTKGLLVSNIEEAGSVNYNVDAEIKGFEGNLVAFLNETTSVDANWLYVESELQGGAMPHPLNPGNIVERIGINPAACQVIPGLGQICAPDPTSSVMVGTADGAGILNYGYGLTADGDVVTMFKSAGTLCLAPFNPLATNPPAPCTDYGPNYSVKGNTLPNSPKLSYSIGVNKDFVMESGILTGRLAYRYQDEREGNAFNDPRSVMEEQKFLDLSFNYQPNNADWYVGAFIKNVNDDRYVGVWAAASALQGGAQFATFTDGRVYGLKFGTDF